ncbi:MAG TPA: hypothetical protein VH279_05805 [Solirubrobacteraceae bacterium]|nr:hypothetical protein [Solirubrobacteraceae bacterium]
MAFASVIAPGLAIAGDVPIARVRGARTRRTTEVRPIQTLVGAQGDYEGVARLGAAPAMS